MLIPQKIKYLGTNNLQRLEVTTDNVNGTVKVLEGQKIFFDDIQINTSGRTDLEQAIPAQDTKYILRFSLDGVPIHDLSYPTSPGFYFVPYGYGYYYYNDVPICTVNWSSTTGEISVDYFYSDLAPVERTNAKSTLCPAYLLCCTSTGNDSNTGKNYDDACSTNIPLLPVKRMYVVLGDNDTYTLGGSVSFDSYLSISHRTGYTPTLDFQDFEVFHSLFSLEISDINITVNGTWLGAGSIARLMVYSSSITLNSSRWCSWGLYHIHMMTLDACNITSNGNSLLSFGNSSVTYFHVSNSTIDGGTDWAAAMLGLVRDANGTPRNIISNVVL